MHLGLISLILFSVALSSGSQIVLKLGMTSPTVQKAILNGQLVGIVQAVVTSPLVICGLASFSLSAIVWLFVLSRVPVSSAYPFVSLGILVTVLVGWLLLGE